MMKKVLFFAVMAIVSFAFTECGTIKMPYKVLSHTIDYGRYYNDDFFISESNSVSFEYVPMGTIMVSMQPGYKVLSEGSQFGYAKYGKDLQLVTEYDVLDQVKEECEKIGANGIINLKISYADTVTAKSEMNGSPVETGIAITATGMAIKRL